MNLLLILTLAIVGQLVEGSQNFIPAVQKKALLATVRVRVLNSVGTGVWIVEGKRKFLLTAAHLVSFHDRAQIEQFWRDGIKRSDQTTQKRILGADLKGDVSLLEIKGDFRTTGALQLAHTYTPGEPVLSVGCDAGKNPYCWTCYSIGKIRMSGRDWILTSRAPAGGRSGGPLINTRGELIGICSARTTNHGIFVSLRTIQRLLATMKKNPTKPNT